MKRLVERRLHRYERHLSQRWQIILAFFLGGAVSSIAQDPSDYVFFLAQAHGYTSAFYQVFLWYDFPAIFYFALFLLGVGLAVTHVVGPEFMLYLYAVLVLMSTVLSFLLPQTSALIFDVNVLIGTAISVGIIIGLLVEIKRK